MPMARETQTEPPTLADRPTPPGKITCEEFLDWADEDTFAEWVDGEVVWMSPITEEHDSLFGFLQPVLRIVVEVRGLGRVFSEPFQMKTGPDLPGRVPDIMFVATANLGRLRRTRLEGPADLVVEIVSPESRLRDSVETLAEYEQGGVREYWLLDQPLQQAKFFGLGADRRYHPLPVSQDGVFRSQVLPDLRLRVEWFWQEPRPAVLDVLREWGLL
jgi:Uma2 family endonuclease